jgi:hypothetical protein
MSINTSGNIIVECQSKSKYNGFVYFFNKNSQSQSLVVDSDSSSTMSSINSSPESLLKQFTLRLKASGGYQRFILATAVTPQGTNVFKIKDLKDISIVIKNGIKMLKCKVSNKDLKIDGKKYSKKAKELKEQTQSLAVVNFSLIGEIKFCTPLILPGTEIDTEICIPIPTYNIPTVENLPPISDGIIGFAPVNPTPQNGWYQASQTGWGQYVWVLLDSGSVINNGYITATWNEKRCILRVWCKGRGAPSTEGDINYIYRWSLWEAMIPTSIVGAAARVSRDEDMFNGRGNNRNNGNIEFRNCSGTLCITPGSQPCNFEKGVFYWKDKYVCPGSQPNWVRVVDTTMGRFSPCPNANSPCYR